LFHTIRLGIASGDGQQVLSGTRTCLGGKVATTTALAGKNVVQLQLGICIPHVSMRSPLAPMKCLTLAVAADQSERTLQETRGTDYTN
jgi:hypothetical protein